MQVQLWPRYDTFSHTQPLGNLSLTWPTRINLNTTKVLLCNRRTAHFASVIICRVALMTSGSHRNQMVALARVLLLFGATLRLLHLEQMIFLRVWYDFYPESLGLIDLVLVYCLSISMLQTYNPSYLIMKLAIEWWILLFMFYSSFHLTTSG